MMDQTGKGRACISEGLTKAFKDVLDQLNKASLKSRRKKTNSMTGPEPAAIRFTLERLQESTRRSDSFFLAIYIYLYP